MNTQQRPLTILDEIRPFERRQAQRCNALGIDAHTMTLSHVAVRCRTWHEYVDMRDDLESVSVANLENVWNGRPISKLVLAEPVPIDGGRHVPVIELIPPFHQRVYRMGWSTSATSSMSPSVSSSTGTSEC
jgi:predicted metalloenzyme YecM